MNSSLHELQSDIQRLATQQHQIQDLTAQHHLQGLVGQQQHHIQVCLCATFYIFVHEFRMGCGLGDLGLDFQSRRDSFLLQDIHTCSEIYPAACSVCIRSFLCRVKQLACEAAHPSSFSAKDNNEWIFSSAPLTCHYDMYRADSTSVLDMKVAVDSKDSKDSLDV